MGFILQDKCGNDLFRFAFGEEEENANVKKIQPYSHTYTHTQYYIIRLKWLSSNQTNVKTKAFTYCILLF